VLDGLDGNVADVRGAALNVVAAILSKMGGDQTRFFKMAGSNLSARGQSLVVERMKHAPEAAEPEKSAAPEKRERPRARTSAPESPAPALDLKIGATSMRTSPLKDEASPVATAENPFTFTDTAVSATVLTPARAAKAKKEEVFEVPAASPEPVPVPVAAAAPAPVNLSPPTTGAAASLRARLASLRGRRRGASSGETATASMSATQAAIEAATASVGVVVVKAAPEAPPEVPPEAPAPAPPTPVKEPAAHSYEECTKVIEVLVATGGGTPLSEDDTIFVEGKESLKILHAALTTSSQDAKFRPVYEAVVGDASATVKFLAKVLAFTFAPDQISVPILSVTLAGLMAIFRSALSKSVDQKAFQTILTETIGLLLNAKLTSADGVAETYRDSQAQLARALNKLAIQVAVSAPRNTAIQGLMFLYMHYARGKDAKLAKIVAKLLTRVTKAEATSNGAGAFGLGEAQDGSVNSCDIEALLCCLEDFLVEVENMEGEVKDNARRIGKGIMMAILGGGADRQEKLKEVMLQGLEFDADTASFMIFQECVREGEGGEALLPAFTPKKEKKVQEGAPEGAPEGAGEAEEFSTPVALIKRMADTPDTSVKAVSEFSRLVASVGSADGDASKQVSRTSEFERGSGQVRRTIMRGAGSRKGAQ
jgi:hypothetical protein